MHAAGAGLCLGSHRRRAGAAPAAGVPAEGAPCCPGAGGWALPAAVLAAGAAPRAGAALAAPAPQVRDSIGGCVGVRVTCLRVSCCLYNVGFVGCYPYICMHPAAAHGLPMGCPVAMSATAIRFRSCPCLGNQDPVSSVWGAGTKCTSIAAAWFGAVPSCHASCCSPGDGSLADLGRNITTVTRQQQKQPTPDDTPTASLLCRLLYNAPAIMQLWNAAAVFVWLGIPVANILPGVFPAHVNRWLGVAALIYYGILTPFLFQVGSLSVYLKLAAMCAATA